MGSRVLSEPSKQGRGGPAFRRSGGVPTARVIEWKDARRHDDIVLPAVCVKGRGRRQLAGYCSYGPVVNYRLTDSDDDVEIPSPHLLKLTLVWPRIMWGTENSHG